MAQTLIFSTLLGKVGYSDSAALTVKNRIVAVSAKTAYIEPGKSNPSLHQSMPLHDFMSSLNRLVMPLIRTKLSTCLI